MVSKRARSLVALSALALLLTGCSTATPTATLTPVDYRACLVTEPGGSSDESLNRDAYVGLMQAVVVHGVQKTVTSSTTNATTVGYTRSINSLVRKQCNLIVTIGDEAATATVRAARANTKTKFVLVDANLALNDATTDLPNLLSLQYNNAQGAFLAGYLAASASKTGKVATYGARSTAAVNAALSGFKQGVAFFNQESGAKVVVLGVPGDNAGTWSYVGTFNSVTKSRVLARKFYAAGADVIMPVAGGAGLGAVEAASSDPGRLVIGFGADWFNVDELKQYQDNILASVTKSIASQIADAIKADINGEFTGGAAVTFVGSLTNDGVALTDEHKVPYPAGVASQLSSLITGIREGSIVVQSPTWQVLP